MRIETSHSVLLRAIKHLIELLPLMISYSTPNAGTSIARHRRPQLGVIDVVRASSESAGAD
jgi:hypothetical protein